MRGEDIFFTQGNAPLPCAGLDKNMSHETAEGERAGVGHERRAASRPSTWTRSTCTRRGSARRSSSRRREELGVKEEVIQRDLGRVLLKLEEMQDAADQARRWQPKRSAEIKLTEDERAEALALLRDPHLLDRIVEDFAQVRRRGRGDQQTRQLSGGGLAALGRAAGGDRAIESSAAGKSSLMDAVLAFVPEEQRVQYSAMTGQSLFYMGETDLKHKMLAIVEEEGAARPPMR